MAPNFSTSSGEVPDKDPDGSSVATFAGGCFWGLELAYQRIDGVKRTQVGYTQGHTSNPSYDEVCNGTTGHTEAVQVVFDESKVSFRSLCDLLWTRIDPTALNRVGNDCGSQYRHGIFFHNEEQRKVAGRLRA